MEIKVMRIFKLSTINSPLKAFADISINDCILIKGVKVIEGKQGLFVTMPQEQGKDNKWYDVVKSLDNETKEQIEKVVFEAYHDKAVA